MSTTALAFQNTKDTAFTAYVASIKSMPDIKAKQNLYQTHLKPWSCNDTQYKIQRVVRYTRENTPFLATRISAAVGGGAAGGAAVGAGVGAAIGFGVGHIPGCATGAIIGAAAGGGLGLVGGISAVGILVREDYIEWKRQYRFQDVSSALLQLQKNNPIFENFECPITNDTFEDPVIIPSGKTYERKAIEDHIKRNAGNASDPYRNFEKPLTLDDLYQDHAMRGFILLAIQSLVSNDLNTISFDADDRKALLSLVRDLKAQALKAESAGRKLITYLRDKQIVSLDVYLVYNEKLNALLKACISSTNSG